MSLKESREGYKERFGGEEREWRNVVINDNKYKKMNKKKNISYMST